MRHSSALEGERASAVKQAAVVPIELPGRFGDPARGVASRRALLEGVQSLAGVDAVGWASTLPLDRENRRQVRIEAEATQAVDTVDLDANVASSYFTAMALPVSDGRGFDAGDTMLAPPVSPGLDTLDTEEAAQRLDDVALVTLDLGRGVVTLHDVMRSYLLHERQDLEAVHGRLVDGYGDWHQLPDPYAWRWLPYHLAQAQRLDDLRALLLTPIWLEAQLLAVGPSAAIQGFAWIQGDSDCELIVGIVRLALPALAADSRQTTIAIHAQLRKS